MLRPTGGPCACGTRRSPAGTDPLGGLTPPALITRSPPAARAPSLTNPTLTQVLITVCQQRPVASEGGGARASDIARSGRPSGVTGAGALQLLSRREGGAKPADGLGVNLARFGRVTSSPSCQPPEVRAAERPSLSLCGSPAPLGPRSCRRLLGSRAWSSPPERK